ncbi:hypothetical protein SAMN05892877_105222 [Rhizobium subbaraonis]|uniref:DUF6538 domain-containing protein n=1 Tax=Rhizobium subbaraonis TaxID=908946 RepID=A0A285UAI5_9HYPH|nr:DUF6538 domain-containing protein [Rhizobium subbaraonis]SOC38707.1 hypothetical protein SAMN05892877_105222 [Rhizobium subbaraonis]
MAAKKQRYMLQKNGIWHFRIMVPMHLREKFGRADFSHSLGTRDFDTAHRKAMALALKYKEMFDAGELPAKRDDYTAEHIRTISVKNGVEPHSYQWIRSP